MYNSDWPVFACALFAFIYYMFELPIMFVVAARVGSYGVGVGAVSPRGAYRRARARAALDRPEPKKKKLFMPDTKALLRLMFHIFKRGKPLYIEISGTINLLDAMYTSLTCAILRCVGASFRDFVFVNVTPDFSPRVSIPEISGIVEIKLGHIMIAAIISASKTAKK